MGEVTVRWGRGRVRGAGSHLGWPACNAPMVGTRTTGPARPARAAASSALVRVNAAGEAAGWLMARSLLARAPLARAPPAPAPRDSSPPPPPRPPPPPPPARPPP